VATKLEGLCPPPPGPGLKPPLFAVESSITDNCPLRDRNEKEALYWVVSGELAIEY